jgi:O-methyltransferase involved in polyketide biosynthesis
METLAAHPIATVLSVGCGLDTRPWRLELPAGLRWIEVDFAAILDYKDRLMARETPHCRRERLVADVNDPSQRRAMYDAVGSASALIITEGLLMYLPAATVESLAGEVRDHTGVAHWITDVTTSAFTMVVAGDAGIRSVRHVQASDSLTGEQILEALRSHRWMTASLRSYITDVDFALDRARQTMGDAPSSPPPSLQGDPSGVHCLARG